MAYDISPYLANEIYRQRREALRLLAAAPPEHRTSIKQVLHDLDVLPAIVAESFLLQALGAPASMLREIGRAIRCEPGPVAAPVAFRRLHRIRVRHLRAVRPPTAPNVA